jgi:hypothetical protein
MDSGFYFKVLYPLQDRVLHILNNVDTDFYLTGGTAASRGYLNHRFSDDLDLFVNDDARFGLWVDRVVQALLNTEDWKVEVLLRDERFARINLIQQDIPLKLELVNDVPARVGDIRFHTVLGRLDSPENILANKITALIDRQEPKDLADIWGFCCQMGLSLNDAITGAQGKAAGVFPLDLARILCSVSREDWEMIRWVEAPDASEFVTELKDLGEKLVLLE